MVRITINSKRTTNAIGLGTIFEADKKANGIARNAPTIVPRKAMAIVSLNK
ncbi:hypothetical protein D3C79_992680 [compost metagenome]